ncbi:MAG: hypothetical protein P8L23_05000 [Flavobacteriales bacterium]|nr:hypothetical protein [Flavobacteriales bacterium]
MKDSLIKKGFILSGIVNILGILVFTKFFTSTAISEADTNVMSPFGLYMIMVWGLAFIAMANYYHKAKWMIAVFCIEKISYVICWGIWMLDNDNDLAELFDKDPFAGTFYALYGPNDLIFFIFFCYVFIRNKNQ